MISVTQLYHSDPQADSEEARRRRRALEDELANGVTGRVVIQPPPVPGSRAAAEAEMMRRMGREMDRHREACAARSLEPDLATLLRDRS